MVVFIKLNKLTNVKFKNVNNVLQLIADWGIFAQIYACLNSETARAMN